MQGLPHALARSRSRAELAQRMLAGLISVLPPHCGQGHFPAGSLPPSLLSGMLLPVPVSNPSAGRGGCCLRAGQECGKKPHPARPGGECDTLDHLYAHCSGPNPGFLHCTEHISSGCWYAIDSPWQHAMAEVISIE